MDGYLGVDLGGTGAKAGVFTATGEMLGFARYGYAPEENAAGHAEIELDEIYCAARNAARDAVEQSGATVRALAISSQGETFASLDATGRPLHRAIMWYDSRAVTEAEELEKKIAEQLKDRAFSIHAIFTAPKILWLRKQDPEKMARARWFLLLPDYLAFRLTGTPVTDPNTAASTGLLPAKATAYDSVALRAAEIDKEQLAEIKGSGELAGRILPEAAKEWGLPAGIPLISGTNDQYAGALGAGNCREGILSATTGTCLALVTLSRNLPALPPGLLSGPFPIDGYSFALAYAKTAGLVLDWFRTEFTGQATPEILEKEAATVPTGCAGLVAAPHFDGMVSPVPDPNVRGAFVGLTLQHRRAHLYRALLESLAFSLKENLDLMRAHELDPKVIRAIGGGARSDILLQTIADLSGLPVERPVVTEAAILGAAMLAALGTGSFTDITVAAETLYQAQRIFEPAPLAPELSRNFACYQALTRNREIR